MLEIAEAHDVKIKYILAFNRMEAKLSGRTISVPAPAPQPLIKLMIRPTVALMKSMPKYYDCVAETSADKAIKQAVVANSGSVFLIDLPKPVLSEGHTCLGSELAEELGMTVQALGRVCRYKALKQVPGDGVTVVAIDRSGTPREQFKCAENGWEAVLQTFGTLD